MSFFLKFFIVLNKTVSNSLILAVNLDLIDIAAVCAFFFFFFNTLKSVYVPSGHRTVKYQYGMLNN